MIFWLDQYVGGVVLDRFDEKCQKDLEEPDASKGN